MQSTHKQEPKLGIRVLARMTGWLMMAAVLACNSDSNTAVNALNRVAIIAVSLSSARLTIGQQVQGNVTLKNSSGVALNGKHVKWTSSNASVASVDATSGMIRALSAGSSTITAAADGAAGSENVDVVAGSSVAAVSVSLPAPTLAVGATMQATAVVADSAGNPVSGTTVTWASTNNSVATVDAASGVVTGVGVGTVSISATSAGVSGSSNLAVSQDGSDGTVATLSIALGAPSIAAGSTTQATATLHDAAGTVLTGLTVAWGSSNAAVASVSSAGVVTGVSAGTATISAASSGVSGTTTITVTAPVGPAPIAKLSVALSATSIAAGATTQATATARDASGNVLTGRVVAWTTNNSAIATVDGSTGLVTGNAAGLVLITATSEGQTGNATLQVTGTVPPPTSPPVASVSVTLAAQSVVAGGSTQAFATTKDAGGNILIGRTVTWSSSDPTIATVSSTGAVGAVAAGTITVTATSEGVTGVATLTVTRVPVATVSVALGSSSIAVGATTQATATARDAGGNVLTGRVVTWSSSNVGVARVSTSGVVTATGAGSATITANSEGQTGAASVTVTQVPVATVGVSLGATSIVVGNTTQASAVTRDASGNLLTGRVVAWSTSNASIASVSTGGVVTGVAAGTATITATSEGKTGSSTVTVTAVPPAPVATVTVALGATSIVAGGTTQATATTTDASGNVLTGRVIAWSSSNAAIATVTSAGVVTGVAAGTSTITATSEGKTGSKSLTVTAAAPAVATQLVITQQPSALVQTGILLSQQPAVQLESATGAKVSQSGVVVTAAVASGIAVLGGTLTATTNASGVATFTNLMLTGIATSTLTFTSAGLTSATSGAISVTAATGFLAANIVDASFETGWNGFTAWDGSSVPNGVSLDSSTASAGRVSVMRSWVPSSTDKGDELLYHVGSTDHVWLRFDVKITSGVSTVMKFMRWYDPSFATSLGGFYLEQGSTMLNFGTDEENASIYTPVGITSTQLIDGRWHTVEMDYWRNGDPSGFPSAAFYLDGNQVSMPDGTPVKYQGAGNVSYWQGGRLYSGVRSNTVKVGYIEMLATLNGGNSTSGQVNIDRVAISTVGRIGP